MADDRPTIRTQGSQLYQRGDRKAFEEQRTLLEATERPEVEAPEPVEPMQAVAEPEPPDEELDELGEDEDYDDDNFDDDPDQDLVDEDEDQIGFSPEGDLSFLYAPTDRPMEPITSGLRVGDGPDDIPLPGETPRKFMLRVARRMASMPGVDKDVKAWVSRVELGG